MKKIILILILVLCLTNIGLSKNYTLHVGKYQTIQHRSFFNSQDHLVIIYYGIVGNSFSFSSGHGTVVYYPVGRHKIIYYAERNGSYYRFTIIPIKWNINTLTVEIRK